MGGNIELGKRNWQFIGRGGSVAIVNGMDSIGLIAKGSFEQTYEGNERVSQDIRRKTIPGRKKQQVQSPEGWSVPGIVKEQQGVQWGRRGGGEGGRLRCCRQVTSARSSRALWDLRRALTHLLWPREMGSH